jgi:hypothetical protein
MFFRVVGAYAPMSRIEFPLIKLFHEKMIFFVLSVK